MTPDAIRSAATLLAAARRSGDALDRLPADLVPPTIADAYRVQLELHRQLAPERGPRGVKLRPAGRLGPAGASPAPGRGGRAAPGPGGLDGGLLRITTLYIPDMPPAMPHPHHDRLTTRPGKDTWPVLARRGARVAKGGGL